MTGPLKIIMLVALHIFALKAAAQDTHYWSQQFGTRSALMGGAVVGGADDNSMIFYNPGALGFLEEANISVNANLYELTSIKVANSLGTEKEFASSQLGSIPLLLSAMVSGDTRKWKIGYALISPVNFSFKGTVRVEEFLDIADEGESPGLEELIADRNLDMKTTETMGGIAFSRKINDHFSLGFSHFLNFRNQTVNYNSLNYMFLNNDARTLVSATAVENIKYYNLRYILKLGAAWYVNDRLSLGLTVTMPSLSLFGTGTVAANIAAQNIRLGSTQRLDLLASDRQDKLKTTYKSPFSIALGANYASDKSRFGLAVEYFGRLEDYAIMKARPAAFVRPEDVFVGLTSDEFLNVYSAADPVLNIAIGYEYFMNENLSFILSFRNNMTHYREVDKPGINVSLSNWDIWHIVTGVNVIRERSTLTLGILPSWGNNKRYKQEGTVASESELINSSVDVTRADYFAVGFLLGYTYHFRKF